MLSVLAPDSPQLESDHTTCMRAPDITRSHAYTSQPHNNTTMIIIQAAQQDNSGQMLLTKPLGREDPKEIAIPSGPPTNY